MQTEDLILSESFTGRQTQKLSAPIVTEGLLLISVALFWYGGFLKTIGLGFLSGTMVASVLLVLALIFADKSKIKILRPHLYLIFFFILALFSGVLAAWRGISPVLLLSGWALFAQFLIATLAAQGTLKPKRLAASLMYLSVPMITVGLYQFVSHQATSRLWLSAAEKDISTRAFAFFGSPNVLGAAMAIVALVSAGLFFSDFQNDSSSKGTIFEKRFMAVIAVAALVVTIFTFSRSAWLGLVVGILVILVIKNWKLVLLSPLALLALFSAQVRTRVGTVFTTAYWFDSSLDGRLWSLNNGMSLLSKYPFFGTGPGTYGGQLALNYSSPVYLQGIQGGYVPLYFTDNEWLQLLVQTGIIGIILFILFVVEMFYSLVSKYNEYRDMLTLSILGAFVVFLITGFFGNVLEFGAISVFMGILLGISFAATPKKVILSRGDPSGKVGMTEKEKK
jgi:putative inorganic carbon (hco3(-)) transporter